MADLNLDDQQSEDLAQQKPDPVDQTAEVVADGGEDGIGGIALAVPEVVAAHSMFRFEMADHGFDRGSPSQLAFDLGGYPPLLA